MASDTSNHPKKQWRQPITAAASVLLAFGLGAGFGVYYHAEISVLANHYLGRAAVPAAPTPTPAGSQQTTLSLTGLTEPLPLVFSETLEESRIQEYLTHGAVVLPLGTSFGQSGNVVVTAHSSGSQSFGQYRFAFAKLAELKTGDQFSVQTPAATYTYTVFGQDVVWPTQVDKLPNDDRSTVTLVTCWPLWTNFKRLLVHGELTKTEYRI